MSNEPNPVDRILLQNAAHSSPEELSELVNGVFTPAECAQRVHELLKKRDWLEQLEKQQLLINDLADIKDMLREKALKGWDTRAAEVFLKAVAQANEIIQANQFDLQAALTQINRAHAQMMLSAIHLALERSFQELERRHAEIPRTELLEVMHASIPAAFAEIEARVVDD
jgi:hypothetical protein